MPSLNYERLCLLFNIGVLQGQIAAAQNFQSDEGLKTAAKMFQVSLSFSKTVLEGKLKGAQCSETIKSRVSSIIMICMKNLRFSSHRRAKVTL